MNAIDGQWLLANLLEVQERVRKSLKESHSSRVESQVKIVAVSKKQPREKLEMAMGVGIHVFGENYVQELKQRMTMFPNEEWHFIGRLQSNKCKDIVGKVKLIHSVDSLSLAVKINTLAEGGNCVQDILLQINIADEPTKGGVSPVDLESMVESVFKLDHVRLKGFMALPPLCEEVEKTRKYFAKVRSFTHLIPNCELSMGTSHDYQVAVEEGATIIRVGELIFGKRE